ncbi:UNVERIFIED_CONTAM: hypothetical protein Sangu_0368100 [Sesamum angustifolium]|uniref:Bifunctional inhibitor/plant lipid transfer protein/seed storage helical domain-containing protein n=1 Tax=Sesamum angustifolium TaxID=2727405 RepID=A0AAW2QRR6_9LAMI
MAHRRSCLCASVAMFLFISSVFRAKAQISTPCTTSVISSFTPCFNYLTGSSGAGSSPTQDCCNSLRSLMTDNVDCACLIITGNVPVSIPFINANLAISLPRVCRTRYRYNAKPLVFPCRLQVLFYSVQLQLLLLQLLMDILLLQLLIMVLLLHSPELLRQNGSGSCPPAGGKL